MTTRYMTPEGKTREVAFWEETKRDFAARTDLPVGPLGGLGYPDPEMFKICDRLNAIPGVCTLQSCAGHSRPDGSVYAGQLWLWLDEATTAAFERVAPILAASPHVERLRKLWLPDGGEVVDVEFTSGASFGRSTAMIVHFFGTLRGQRMAS